MKRKSPAGGSADRSSLRIRIEAALKTLFDKMDIDKDGSVTKDEATKFFKSFSKINANVSRATALPPAAALRARV